MKTKDIMNISSLEEVILAINEIADDKKALNEIQLCMDSLGERLNELTAYGDKKVEEALALSMDLYRARTMEELVEIKAKVQDGVVEIEKVKAILVKMQEYMRELTARSNAIAAKYKD